jgi:hypothetical protein
MPPFDQNPFLMRAPQMPLPSPLPPAAAQNIGPRTPSPFDLPVYQHPAVLAQMAQMWQHQQNGNTRTESTMVLHSRRPDGTPIIRSMPDTADYSRETFGIMPGDTQIIHTHPNVMDARPSQADMDIANKYGVEMYTVSKDGLYRYAPGMKKAELAIQGTDFLNHPNAFLAPKK